MPPFPALALLEFDSIAIGILASDAMVKQSPVAQILTGTVHPGRYLTMVTGDVATVDEAVKIGLEVGHSALCDSVFLPDIHPDVISALGGPQQMPQQEALGIVETIGAAAIIKSADAGIKGAEVSLIRLRLSDGLGGKGLLFFVGLVADVEAAVEIAGMQAGHQLKQQVVIPQLHSEMVTNITTNRFGDHFQWQVF